MTREQYDFLFNKARKIMQKTKDQNHDWSHIKSVLENADKIFSFFTIKQKKKINLSILRIAIVFHDLSYAFYKTTFKHYFFEGRRTIMAVRPILEEAKLSSAEKNLICDIIKHHVAKELNLIWKRNKHQNLMHQLMQDADTMDGSGFNYDRLKKAKESSRNSFYWWFAIKILEPIFGKYLFSTNKIYNLVEIVNKIKAEGYKGYTINPKL